MTHLNAALRNYIWIGKRDEERSLFAASYLLDDPPPGACSSIRRRPSEIIGTQYGTQLFPLKELLLNQLNNLSFVWYDEMWAHQAAKITQCAKIAENCCSESLLRLLGNKVELRKKNLPFAILPGAILPKEEVCYLRARSEFPDYSEFVIHGAIGTSCDNIFRLLDSGDDRLMSELSGESLIVTPLMRDAIPMNIHVFVGVHNCSVAPPSVQLISPIAHRRLFYGGADFAAANMISKKDKEKIQDFGMSIGDWLRQMGYLGVVGIDFLFSPSGPMLVEINARFQASTYVLNEALLYLGLPTCQALHVLAKNGESLPDIYNAKCFTALLITITTPPIHEGETRACRNSLWRSMVPGPIATVPLGVFPSVSEERLNTLFGRP